MSEMVKEITDKFFDKTIASGVVLLDFWAPWCGPCQMQGPILEKVAAKVGEKAVIGKVNVDENMESAGKFGVQSIPTLILFKNGKEHKKFIGVQQESELVAAIEGAQ